MHLAGIEAAADQFRFGKIELGKIKAGQIAIDENGAPTVALSLQMSPMAFCQPVESALRKS
ncbi:MAG: hypothetical protein WDN69_35095 [Aliidongia sp.]